MLMRDIEPYRNIAVDNAVISSRSQHKQMLRERGLEEVGNDFKALTTRELPKAEPVKDWLSTLPARTPLKTMVRLAKIRWRIEHDYRELKTGLGVDHFEGRSFIGWHRHVTLTVLAQAFCTLLRLDPKVDVPA